MSSTPIYDELAAILLADNARPADAAQPAQPEVKDEPSGAVRTGGRRRKPEPDA